MNESKRTPRYQSGGHAQGHAKASPPLGDVRHRLPQAGTSEEEPKREIRLEIVRRQLKLWQNTLYEAKVQARVANVIDNDSLAVGAAQNVEQAIRAIDELTALLDELLEPITGPAPSGAGAGGGGRVSGEMAS